MGYTLRLVALAATVLIVAVNAGENTGKAAGMTKEERQDFMRQWKEDKGGRRELWQNRIQQWRATEKAKGKIPKEGDGDLPENAYTALVNGKPQTFRGDAQGEKVDAMGGPEETNERPETVFKGGKFPNLSEKSKGPKADGLKRDQFSLVSRNGQRKSVKGWSDEDKKRWQGREDKRNGKGGQVKKSSDKRSATENEEREKRAEAITAQASGSYGLWPSPYINYVFDSGFSAGSKPYIREAMNRWESKSCLKFTEGMPPTGKPYIYIGHFDDDGGGCWSYVGARTTSPYYTKLNPGWCRNSEHIGNMAHELGHAVGLSHTQKRVDRDDHIKVYLNLIDDTYWKAQYAKNSGYSYDDYGIPYRYESLMHYPVYYYGDGQTELVICALEPLASVTMGQRAEIMHEDFAFANKLYCEEECVREADMSSTTFEGSTLSQTISGRDCQKWSENTPHNHSLNSVGTHNYCRNPDGWEGGPWCYTTDSAVLMEPCISSCEQLDAGQIPKCEGYCHNGGFFDAMCKCLCPEHVSGEHCEIRNLTAKYSFLQCGGKEELKADGGIQSVQSQNYPNNYDNNQLCKWWIQAPVGMFVAMEVVDFRLERSNSGQCVWDYVQIELSNCPDTPPNPNDIRYCGNALDSKHLTAAGPYIQASKTRDLIIEFKSDGSVTDAGFKLDFWAFK